MKLTSSHWGIGCVETDGNQITAVHPHPADPDPSRLNENIAGSLNGRARIRRPAVRASWLKGEAGERGRDPFVELPWDTVLDLIAERLANTIKHHGNESIFAGSYGWASAGRFHHAQSQLKRFLNCLGGSTFSKGNYSYNAALVALPHIVGGDFRQHVAEATRWSVIAENSDLVVAFGGLPFRNMQISDGGASKHRMRGAFQACVDNGVQFVNISPLRSDVENSAHPIWMAPRLGTDVALMLGLAHTLLDEGLHDQAFLDRYTVGFERVSDYLLGADGVPKTADWAAETTGIPAQDIRALARRMAGGRTMITCAAGLQRADWGEQPLWMTVTLAAMLGQIGLPGGGYGIAYAVNGHVGNIQRPFRWGNLPQGENPIKTFIPVAMITDLLTRPNESYFYDGQTLTFPDIKMVWWAGGNPFHHHQDLNGLRNAFQRPETIIVNELNWTATARHADIVLPVAASGERMDFGGGYSDNILVPMPKLVDPPGEARVEYDIYCALAQRMGVFDTFSEGRSKAEWIKHLWDITRNNGAAQDHDLPTWNDFIAGDIVEVPDPAPSRVFLSEFRSDPDKYPRPTPSGKIELFSDVIASYGLTESPGHATFRDMRDRTDGLEDNYPLALVSGQPRTRLHSQHDTGAWSLSEKVQGREPVLINPTDAEDRGITDGDVVEVFNNRGRCLAGARVTADIAQGHLFLWTGAWYDPDFDKPQNRDRHGNPNVLTHDRKTSAWSQSPASHSALVDVRVFKGPVPEITVHDQPRFVRPVDVES